MNQRALAPLLFAAFASSWLLAAGAQSLAAHNVLVLYSNTRLLPANILVDEGLREGIAARPARDVELFAEFLDQPTFSGPSYEETIANYLRLKYAARPPEVVIVAGQPAFDYVLRLRNQLFPDTPIVHVAVDSRFIQSRQPLPKGVFGVPADYDYAGTVDLALRLHPQARRLVVVTGASYRDRQYEADTRAALARLAHLPPLEFLSGLPPEELSRRLHALDRNDLVFTPGYYRDGAGAESTPREAATFVAAASAAPVFGPYSTFIGTGVVGGRMPDYEAMGEGAIKLLNSLLDGGQADAPQPSSRVPAQVHLDWRQIERWDIDPALAPEGAVVHFREPGFWETHRNLVLIVLALILVQAASIVALLIERSQRRRTAFALDDSQRQLGLAARAARLSVFRWNLAHPAGAGARPRRAGTPSHSEFESFLASVHAADRPGLRAAVERTRRQDEELDIEFRETLPDGSVRWSAARGRREQDRPELMTGVKLDITARKNAEVQAISDREALTRMTRVSTLGQLSASFAHQLNQPLAAILGNAEAARQLLRHEPPDTTELAEICEDIIREDQRAAQIIRRLGALFRRSEIRLVPLNLDELIAETIELVRSELTLRHVSVIAAVDPGLPAVDGSRVELQQVLLNLILNAADAMAANGPEQRTVTVKAGARDADVHLCVIDQGPGIPQADLPHVFEPFWTTKPGGTGVGLAICKVILAAHRGTLTAENNTAGGSSFCADWPRRQAC